MTSASAAPSPPADSYPSGEPPYIEVDDLVVSYGDLDVVDHVSFQVRHGQQLSLLGPSGCGKTTTLRCIAGLETPRSGTIRIDGTTVFSSAERINVPTEKRDLSLMFQSYAIWPHMSVAENVAYALKLRKTPKSRIRERVAQVLAMVGMERFADTPATQLSGGQQQRVALARSYAHPPKALLLDEPLSNLDARLRDQVRDDLKAFQRTAGITTIYVTHDQEEAMALSDRIIVMRSGRIVQDAEPLTVYRRPRNAFVADFIGAANVLTGQVRHRAGRTVLECGDADLELAEWPEPPVEGRRCSVAVRTVHPQVTARRDEMPPPGPNVWPATVESSLLLGDYLDLRVRFPGGVLRVKNATRHTYTEGQPVWLAVPSDTVVPLEDDE